MIPLRTSRTTTEACRRATHCKPREATKLALAFWNRREAKDLEKIVPRMTIWLSALLASACGADAVPNDGQSVPDGEPETTSQRLQSDLAPSPNSMDADVAKYQTAAEAFETDIGIVVKETGLAPDVVRASLRFQSEFAAKAHRVLGQSLDQVAAVWVDPLPAAHGHVVFVGGVPELAADLVADPNVSVKGGAVLSMGEQYHLVRDLAGAMEELGLRAMTAYDHRTQRIRVRHEPEPTRGFVNKQVVVDAVARRLGRPPTVGTADFDLEEVAEASLTPTATVRGGTTLQDDGSFECTSGFAVANSSGVRGLLTAAHCNGLNQVVVSVTHSMSFQAQVSTYSQGDVEWHSTAGSEIGSFFADSSNIRDVEAAQHTSFQVGSTVCHYGRGSNVRTCNHSVDSVNSCVFATAPVNATVCNLALTDSPGNTTTGGDSGGGWSFNTTAWGIHTGCNSTVCGYTPIVNAISVLGLAELLGFGE